VLNNQHFQPQLRDSFIIESICGFDIKMVRETEQIVLESLCEKITDRFEYIAEIYVAHAPSALDVSWLHITVHTTEADSLKQSLEITTAEKSAVMVDTGRAKPLSIPFDVMATIDGPGHRQGINGTTVYMNDRVMSADSRELDTGLLMLRQKLAGECPSCGDSVESFSNHYKKSRICRERERI
jgi:hypothetical protein